MLRLALVAGAYVAVAILETSPLIRRFTTHLPSDLGDPLLTTWIMAWSSRALLHHPFALFDANIAYPLEGSLAFSDHLLGVVPAFAPAYVLTGDPITAANTVFLLSFALSALAAFCLVYACTSAFWPSFLGGLLFGFAPFRFGQLSHVQLLNFFWCPWALLFLLRFLQTRRRAPLAVFSLFYCLQVLASAYLAFMVTVAVAVVVVVWAVAVDRTILRAALVRPALVAASAMAIVLVPASLPYVAVHRAWDAAWTVGGMVGMSADPLSYLSAPPLLNDFYASTLTFANVPGGHERRLFPGLVLPALALLGGLATMRSVGMQLARSLRLIFGVMLAVAIVLSLGPYLVLFGFKTHVPLPYLLLYYIVPGWSGMRVPARFGLLAVLAATPLAALGAIRISELIASWRLGRRWSPKIPALVCLGLAALFLAELGAKPLPLVALPTRDEVPRVYSWLAVTRPGPVLELPLEESGDQRYVLLSTIHWLPLVNGRSGFAPPPHEDLRAILATFPAPRALEYAATLGVGTIVVHTDRLPAEQAARLYAAEAAGRVRRLAAFGPDVAYGVGPPPAANASLSAEVATASILPAERDSRLGLLVRAIGGHPWVQRRPRGLSSAVLEWVRDDGGPTIYRQARVALPLVVGAEDQVSLPVRTRTPAAGRYALRLSIPAMGLVTPTHPVLVQDGPVQASHRSGAHLAAAYEVPGRDNDLRVPPAGFLPLTVIATNRGDAIWLSRAPHNRGEVALHWRWLDDQAAPAAVAGAVRLRHEVFPGQRYPFRLEVPLPVKPGAYVLEMSLVSQEVTTFAAASSPPLQLPVRVR